MDNGVDEKIIYMHHLNYIQSLLNVATLIVLQLNEVSFISLIQTRWQLSRKYMDATERSIIELYSRFIFC